MLYEFWEIDVPKHAALHQVDMQKKSLWIKLKSFNSG